MANSCLQPVSKSIFLRTSKCRAVKPRFFAEGFYRNRTKITFWDEMVEMEAGFDFSKKGSRYLFFSSKVSKMAAGHFAEKTFCQKTFCQKNYFPKRHLAQKIFSVSSIFSKLSLTPIAFLTSRNINQSFLSFAFLTRL